MKRPQGWHPNGREDETMHANSTRGRHCAACLTGFRPAQPWHLICRRCYAWHRFGCLLAEMRRAIAEART
jgi:hypothetical protein